MSRKNIALSLLLLFLLASIWAAIRRTQHYISQVNHDREEWLKQAEMQSRVLADSLNTLLQQASAADRLAAALLRASQSKFFLIRYRDNLLTKTLFWPSFLGTGLIVTLLLFYPGLLP